MNFVSKILHKKDLRLYLTTSKKGLNKAEHLTRLALDKKTQYYKDTSTTCHELYIIISDEFIRRFTLFVFI